MRILFTLLFILSFFNSFTQVDIPGCTSFGAWNYNPAANVNDGSCCFNRYITVSPADSVWVLQEDGIAVPDANGAYCSENLLLLEVDPQYTGPITITSASGQTYTFNVNDILFQSNPDIYGYYIQLLIENEIVPYCWDVNACNYTPSTSEYSYYSHCDYSCVGCIDPNAYNYEPTATIASEHCCTDPENIIFISSSNPNTSLKIVDEFDHEVILTNFTTDSLCMNGSCYYIESTNFSDDSVSYTFSNFENVIFHTVIQEPSTFRYFRATNGGILGCTDSNALNYNPDATCSDNQSCIENELVGCMDPSYFNYDPEAIEDDGTCCTQEHLYYVTSNAPFTVMIYDGNYDPYYYLDSNEVLEVCTMSGCVQLLANVNSFYANIENPVLTITDAFGNVVAQSSEYYVGIELYNNPSDANICTDPYACNYTPGSGCDIFINSSCDYSCLGCTDPNATNFSPLAYIDDQSCCYGLYSITSPNISNVSVLARFSDTNESFAINDLANNTFCVPPGCISLEISANPATSVTLYDGGELLFTAIISNTVFYISNQSIEGCTDAVACNYNPEANCNLDDNCDYSCIGCTNPSAENYSPTATIDMGTCCEFNYLRINTSIPSDIFLENNTMGLTEDVNYENGWCAGSACYTIYANSSSWETFTYEIIDIEGNVVQSGYSDPIGFAVISLSSINNFLCGDPIACNFSPEASACFNEIYCDFSCYGCTDPNAPNYDSLATFTSNSCCYDDWFRFEFSDDAYFQVLNNNSSFFENGHYPIQNGACIPLSCFHLDVWSYNSVPIDYTIYNPDNIIIAQGSSSAAGQISIDLARDTSEIAGCLIPSACNYNPDATCSSGYCAGCQGCTDPTALNFVSFATIEDGSCFYDIDQPLIQESIIYSDDQNNFLVRLDFMSLGNVAPFLVTTNNEGLEGLVVQTMSSEFIGPFSCSENVVITIESLNPFTPDFHQSLSIDGGCVITNTEEKASENLELRLFPNPANTLIHLNFDFQKDDKIIILDMMGKIVQEKTIEDANSQTTLDLNHINAGVYIVHLQRSSTTIEKKKMIKQ